MLMSPYKTQSNFLKSHSLKLFLPLKNLLAVCSYKIRKKNVIYLLISKEKNQGIVTNRSKKNRASVV